MKVNKTGVYDNKKEKQFEYWKVDGENKLLISALPYKFNSEQFNYKEVWIKQVEMTLAKIGGN